MKKYLFVVVLFITGYGLAQTNKTYLVKFTSKQNIPTTSLSRTGNIVLNFNAGGKSAMTIEATEFVEEFANFNSPSLQDVYKMTIVSSESSKLSTLSTSGVIGNYEELQEDTLLNEEMFLIPNDYYLNSNPASHTYLDLINAQEAWDYSTGDNTIIGIPDLGFNLNHLEIKDKITCVTGTSCSNHYYHGSQVSGLAAAETNNNVGNASIGYNLNMFASNSWSPTTLKTMSDNGAKAINMSWLSWGHCNYNQFYQDAVNEIVDQGTVLVAASGNGANHCGSIQSYIYPASYDNVISVSGVGHINDVGSGATSNLKDVHVNDLTSGQTSIHNDKVDLVGPAYFLTNLPSQSGTTGGSTCWFGTSCSAPLVTGTIGLMADVNDCISPQEIEAILKITSADIDQISHNQPFAGMLGSGRLDSGLAVKASYKMKNNQLVTFSDKKINRFDLKLDNTLYEVELEEVEFTGTINMELIAEKSITLSENTLLSPDTSSSNSIFLDVDGVSGKCFVPVMSRSSNNLTQTIKEEGEPLETIQVYPTLFTNYVFVKDAEAEEEVADIYIYDINKRLVYKKSEVSLQEGTLNLSSLKRGMYVIEVEYGKGKSYSTKLFKQ